MTFWGGRSLVDLQLHMTSHGTGIFAMPTGDSRISSINEKYHNLNSTPSKFQLHLRITVNIWSVTQSDNLHLHPLHKNSVRILQVYTINPHNFSQICVIAEMGDWDLSIWQFAGLIIVGWWRFPKKSGDHLKSNRGSSQNKESMGRASHIPRLFPELPGTSEEFLKLLCSCLKLEKKNHTHKNFTNRR